MKLLVVRHGVAMDRGEYQADPLSEAKNDDLRPLTQDGIRKMRKNTMGLIEAVGRPDMLISSPLTRALQTAEILRDTWEELPITHCAALGPEAKPSEFISWFKKSTKLSVGSVASADSLVVIVGHEPHLTSLISWLVFGRTGSFLELKKGGACLLELENDFAKGSGVISWLATPKLLRGMR